MADITLVWSEDWIGLYKDGRLLDQGHSFDDGHLLDLVGVEHDSFEALMDDGDRLPYTLAEVRRHQ